MPDSLVTAAALMTVLRVLTASVDSVAVAVRVAPPRLDGHLADSVWNRAIPITRFVQRDPVEGAPVAFPTEARVVYTGDAIYVGVRAFDPEPEHIMAPLARRDERPVGDWVAVMIDSYYDRRTAFEFAVNAAGVRHDTYRFNDFEADASWDANWDAEVSRDAHGWSAEFRIPLSELRFIPRAAQRFGFNIYRVVGRTLEVQYWQLISKQEQSFVSRFGDLVGLENLDRPSPLSGSPYVAAGDGSPGNTGSMRVGVDARIAVARLGSIPHGVTALVKLSYWIEP